MSQFVGLKLDHTNLIAIRGHGRLFDTVTPQTRASFKQTRGAHTFRVNAAAMGRLTDLVANNKNWAASKIAEQSDYFSRYANGQWPEFLWVGCADSRVVGNDIICMSPGDVFTHRNVGNVISHSDMNVMSVLEYGIGALLVKHVIVCGHYGCGAVKASLTLPPKTAGVVNCWISQIRDVRNLYWEELCKLPEDKRPDYLSEMNALHQALHVCTSAPVQAAWAKGQELTVHCVVYNIATGKLNVLATDINSLEDILKIISFTEGNIKGNAAIKATFDKAVKGIIELESVPV